MYNELQPSEAEKINTDATQEAIAAAGQAAAETGLTAAGISPKTNDPNPTPATLAGMLAEVERVFNERLDNFISTYHRFIEDNYKGAGKYHVE